MARERIISDSRKTHVPNGISPNSSVVKINIKPEVSEDITAQNGDQLGDQTTECPISIIPENRTSSTYDQNATPQVGEEINNKPRELQDKFNPADSDTLTDFPVYEIALQLPTLPTILVTILPSFDALVGMLDHQSFIDVVNFPQETFGSAANPIVLEIEDNTIHEADNAKTPAELILIHSDSPSPE